MTLPILSSQKMPSPASVIGRAIGVLIVLAVVIVAVLGGTGWLLAVALTVPFWNGVALATALIVIIWFGNAIVSRK